MYSGVCVSVWQPVLRYHKSMTSPTFVLAYATHIRFLPPPSLLPPFSHSFSLSLSPVIFYFWHFYLPLPNFNLAHYFSELSFSLFITSSFWFSIPFVSLDKVTFSSLHYDLILYFICLHITIYLHYFSVGTYLFMLLQNSISEILSQLTKRPHIHMACILFHTEVYLFYTSFLILVNLYLLHFTPKQCCIPSDSRTY